MMVQYARRIGILAFVFLASAQVSKGEEWADKLEEVQLSVVEIVATGPTASGTNFNNIPGSGFLVYSDEVLQETYLITAAHVINPPTGWADKAVDTGPDRTIRVRSEKPEAKGQFATLAGNASVIAEDVAGDFAVLSIPIQLKAKTLPLTAAGSQLKVRATLAIAGFPAGKGYRARTLPVWEGLNESKSRFVLDGVAEAGQSGGPVIDAGGRAVALISENDDKASPKYHSAVIVSQPLDLLNNYLRKRGRPLVPLVDSSPSKSKFRVVQRIGRGSAYVTGDTGDLSKGKQETTGPHESVSVSTSATGDEKSDCIESLGRWTSSAFGSVSVKPFELTGMKLRLETAAKGGHFTNATACLGGVPVGLVGTDTAATSKVSGEGSIFFEPTSIPFDLRIVWRDLSPDVELRLIDPSAQIEVELSPTDPNGERIAKIETTGKWELRINVTRTTQASSTTNSTIQNSQPLVFLETK